MRQMLRCCHVLPMLRATFLLAARHVISGGATRLVSSHLISSVLTACAFTAHIYTHTRTQCLSTLCLPASFHSQGRRT